MILLQFSVISMSWCNLNGCWRSHETWQTIYLLFLGQVVSFVLALGSFTSSLIADLGNLKNPSFGFMHCSASLVDDHDFFFFFVIYVDPLLDFFFCYCVLVLMHHLLRLCFLTSFWLLFMGVFCCLGVRDYW